MFCPKCGTQNPETGKYCRSCGTDLGNVSAALSGDLSSKWYDTIGSGCGETSESGVKARKDPNELYGDSIKQMLSGIGFLMVSMALLFTGVAGGKAWWWAMLFPAFTFLAKGISDYMKYKKVLQSNQVSRFSQQGTLNSPPNGGLGLPPTSNQYIAPHSRYKTGDLVPPSVAEGTTRHLEINNEGETMTLPKK